MSSKDALKCLLGFTVLALTIAGWWYEFGPPNGLLWVALVIYGHYSVKAERRRLIEKNQSTSHLPEPLRLFLSREEREEIARRRKANR